MKLIYKLWKEGKIICSKEDMSRAWQFFYSYSVYDLQHLEGMKNFNAHIYENADDVDYLQKELDRLVEQLHTKYCPIGF